MTLASHISQSWALWLVSTGKYINYIIKYILFYNNLFVMNIVHKILLCDNVEPQKLMEMHFSSFFFLQLTDPLVFQSNFPDTH